MEVISFCKLIVEVKSHYFCCILLVRSKSLDAAPTQGEGNCPWIGIQGSEVMEGQLRTLPTIQVNKNTFRSSIRENRNKNFQLHVLKKSILGHYPFRLILEV